MAVTATQMDKRAIGRSDRRFRLDGLGLTLVIVALAVMFTLINPNFATITNFLNVLTQASTYVILAMGMTFVISSAGIDLSIGSILALVTCLLFWMIQSLGMPSGLAVPIMFGLAVLLGLINGVMITYLAIPALIATLGSMVTLRGFALVHSAGNLWFGLPPELLYLGQGKLFGVVPVPVIIAAFAVAACYWLFKKTRFGVHVCAVGGNREAARLAGIRINRVTILVYVLMAACTALGGLLWVARVDGTQATIGTGMEIHVIAAVIIGGTSLFGGKGSIYGAVLGAILLSMLNNALVIAGADFFWQQVVIGLIVVAAVIINNVRENRIGWLKQLRTHPAIGRK
ncbi:MAG: ABC transporter permease [Alphaproteobacteria bacterium]